MTKPAFRLFASLTVLLTGSFLSLLPLAAAPTKSTSATNKATNKAAHKTTHVIFVMTDGLRWQEVFGGADEQLMNKDDGGVTDVEALKKAYWRDTPGARREALMPFLWTVIARQGQVYGNRKLDSPVSVTNGHNFSYPGYSETLCGFSDARINSNDKVPNPNVTMFEWLNQKPAYRNKIAVFGAWDVIADVVNPQRSGILANAGYNPLTAIPMNAGLEMLNRMKSDLPHVWPDEPYDAVPFYTAVEYLKAAKPKVLYLSLGETDEWAHAGDYTNYLNSAHRADSFVKALWNLVQSMPEYRGHTTLIFSPDHGRGEAPREWKNHGEKIPDSKYIWMAYLGPDTQALGERHNIPELHQDQIAATLTALLGEDYPADVPKAGKPLRDVVQH